MSNDDPWTADGLHMEAAGGCIYPEAVCGYREFGTGSRTVVDIGAHVGALTCFAAKDGASVLSIEADPRNYRCLLQNIQNNSLERTVIPFNNAVWRNGSDRLQLFTHEREQPNACANLFEGAHPLEVQPMGITAVLEWFGRIDYLKIDVEGAEYVFLDLDDPFLTKLLKRVSVFDMEWHDPGPAIRTKRLLPCYKDIPLDKKEATEFCENMLLKHFDHFQTVDKPINKRVYCHG